MPSPGCLRNILVATDFSRGAESAMAWAMAIAKAHGAALTIVHGVAPPPRPSIALDLQSLVDERLAEVAERARREGIATETAFEFGRPWEVLARVQADLRADLIVVGSRGHTPAAHLRMGRVADRVIRTVDGPVLTVHPDDGLSSIRIGTVLTAVDFSAESAIAAETAANLIRGFAPPRRLILLHACHDAGQYAVGEVAGLIAGNIAEIEPPAEIAPRLEALAQKLRVGDLTVESITSEGYAMSAIEAVAAQRNVDLIAMGVSGRAGLGRVLLGSIAERTLQYAPCPVLTVRHASASSPDSGSDVGVATVSG